MKAGTASSLHGRVGRRLMLLGAGGFGALIATVLLITGNALILIWVIGSVVVTRLVLHVNVDRLLPLVVFFTFALDNPAEQPYTDKWSPVWNAVSEVWFNNIRKTIPGTLLPLSPLLLILIACSVRALSSARNRGSDTTTAHLRRAGAMSFAALAAVETWGVVTGGSIDTSVRQAAWLVAVPLVAVGVTVASRSSHRLIHRLELAVITGALFKALVAIYGYQTVIKSALDDPITYSKLGAPIPPPEYLSTHSDSVLWAWALLLLGGYWLEGRRKGSLLTIAVVGSPIMLAIVWNDRRTTWVGLGGAFVFSLALARPVLKRQIRQFLTVTWPLMVGYVVVGWVANSPVFAPVKAIKSVFSSSDESNITRDAENLNLIITSRARPLIGFGFGHPYIEAVRSFDISGSLVEYRFIPHNSLLGLFAFAGPIGFLGFWSIVVVAVTLCVRAYRMLPVGRSGASVATRVRAGWAVGGLILYSIQSWADIGLQSPYPALIAGLCCGIAGAAIRDAHAIRDHPLVGADLARGPCDTAQSVAEFRAGDSILRPEPRGSSIPGVSAPPTRPRSRGGRSPAR